MGFIQSDCVSLALYTAQSYICVCAIYCGFFFSGIFHLVDVLFINFIPLLLLLSLYLYSDFSFNSSNWVVLDGIRFSLKCSSKYYNLFRAQWANFDFSLDIWISVEFLTLCDSEIAKNILELISFHR